MMFRFFLPLFFATLFIFGAVSLRPYILKEVSSGSKDTLPISELKLPINLPPVVSQKSTTVPPKSGLPQTVERKIDKVVPPSVIKLPEPVEVPLAPIAEPIERLPGGGFWGVLSQLSSDEIYQKLNGAVVQIVCARGANAIVSGSGVIVSPSGVVLSNAHVLEGSKDCIVKAGSPAVIIGALDILYIGDTKAKIASSEVPQQDFAFGKIKTDSSKRTFKYMELDAEYSALVGDGLYAAAYPTELIGGSGLLMGGQTMVYTTTKIESIYRITETGDDTDVIELSGSIATQQGSSGSPVISPRNGKVVGLVFGQTGTSDAPGGGGILSPTETSKRTELAFLIQYLERVIKKEKGTGIQELIDRLDAGKQI